MLVLTLNDKVTTSLPWPHHLQATLTGALSQCMLNLSGGCQKSLQLMAPVVLRTFQDLLRSAVAITVCPYSS